MERFGNWDVKGILGNSFRISDRLIKAVSHLVQFRDSLDTTFSRVQGADPVSDDDFVNKRYFDSHTSGGSGGSVTHHLMSPMHPDVITTGTPVSSGDVLFWNGVSWRATNIGTNFVYASASKNLTNISATLGSGAISLSVGNYLTTAMASDAGSLFMGTGERSNLQYTSATSAITSAAFPSANSTDLMNTSERTNYMGTTERSNFVYTSVSLNLTNISASLGSSGISLSVGNYITTAMASEDSSKFVQAWELDGANVSGDTSSLAGTKLYLSGDNRITLSGTGNTIKISANVSDLFVAANSTNLMNTSERSNYMGSTERSNYVASSASLNLTNISASLGSAGVSLSVGAYLTTAMASGDSTKFVQAWSLVGGGGSGDVSSLCGATLNLSADNRVVLSGSGNTVKISVKDSDLFIAANSSALVHTSVSSKFVQAWSIKGNTSGDASTLCGSKLDLSGGNRITLSGNANAIAISVNDSDLALGADSSKYLQAWALTGAHTAGTVSSLQGTKLYLSGGDEVSISGNSNTLVFYVNTRDFVMAGDATSLMPAANSSNYVQEWLLSGNTLGTSVNTSVGSRLYLQGGDRITLSGSGNTVVVSVQVSDLFVAANSSLLAGSSVASRVIGIAGSNASTASGNVQFANSNNLTFGLSGNTITASFSQSVQAAQTGISGIVASDATYTSGTVIFSNQGNVTIGTSVNGASQYVCLSVAAQSAQPAQTGISGIVASDATYSSGTVIFSNVSNVTVCSSANGASQYVRLSVADQSAQPRVISLNGMSQSLTLSGASNVSVSTNGSTIYAYGPASVLFGISVGGNTGTTGSSNVYNSGFVLAGGNNITLSQSNATISVVGAAQSAQPAVGSLNGSSGTMSISGASNITASNNASTITVYGPASVLYAVTVGGNSGTTGSSQVANSGFMLAGGNNVTVKISNNTISISGANTHAQQTGISAIAGSAASSVTAGTVQFANGNNISFGLNSVTMTASYMQWLSSYEVVQPLGATGAQSFNTNTSGPISLYGFELRHGVLADHCGVIVSMNYDGVGQSSYRQSGTLGWALYTRPTAANSTQLDTIQSSSFTYGVTYNSGAVCISHPATTSIGANDYGYAQTSSNGNNLTSLFTGVKLLWLNLKQSLTPGHYWIGLHHRNISNSNNYGIRMSLHGPAQTLTGLLPFGLSAVQSTGTDLYAHWGGNWNPFGVASYSTNAMTFLDARISVSQLTADLTVFPYLRFASRITV